MPPESKPSSHTPLWPPPVRLAAPLLVLVFGLMATWFDYWLALDVHQGRELNEARTRAEAVTHRLATNGEVLLREQRVDLLRLSLETLVDVPDLVIAGLVDAEGRVLAASMPSMNGQKVKATPLAKAAALIQPTSKAVMVAGEDAELVYAAFPLQMPDARTGWSLIELNRADSVAVARQDALLQLAWTASAMVLLSFALWSVLHFGYASRLASLAERLRRWHAGEWEAKELPRGADEVGRLAESFGGMMGRLKSYEEEQSRLEREVLAISESERQRIGHDLHDGLGQRLTAASMAANGMLEAVRQSAPELAAHGELVTRQLREAIAEARALSHGLAPVSMEADGLWLALKEMAASVTASGKVRCVLEEPPPSEMPPVQAGVQLFRIAQEAVNNALKHAECAEVRVGLSRQGGGWSLEVEDDGSGFDEARPPAEGLGMRVMRYRASLIGATLEVRNAAGGGTLIRCVMNTPLIS